MRKTKRQHLSGDSKWFFENGLMKLTPDQKTPNENSILSTITYAFIYNLPFFNTVFNSLLDNGQIAGTRSHDNMTAIITYLVKRGYNDLANKIKILPHYIHPRDIFYIAYVQRRWWAFLGFPFMLLDYIHMGITVYKTRPTLWDWFIEGFPPRTKIRKTDTEILYWIRLQLPREYKFIHWTAKIIVPLFKRKFEEDWFKSMMQLWYRHPYHPNRNF